jgi:hypothetical protein
MGFDRRKRPARPGGWRTRVGEALLLGSGLLGWERAAGAKPEAELLAVQRAALAHAGLSPGATSGLLARQHLSGLLPQVRVTLGQGWQLSVTGRPLDGLTVPPGDDTHTSYAVSASWDLTRLLVPREAMQLHHAEPRRAQQRLALLVRVGRLVGARCRLLQTEGLRASEQERVAEYEAALDLLTGGYALPEVTPQTRCPALPRFQVGGSRHAVGLSRPGGRAAAAELADDGEEEDPLTPAREPAEYGVE